MNPEDLARLYHLKIQEFGPKHGLNMNQLLWEDLSEATRETAIEVAGAILENTLHPFVGTPDNPRVTYTVEDTKDNDLTAIKGIEAVLEGLNNHQRNRVLNFVRERQFEAEFSNQLLPENTLTTEHTHA